MEHYSPQFFEDRKEGAGTSAREVVPLVLDLVQPRSVIDVGCGIGSWLAIFCELGLEDFHGIDGNYVDAEALLIPREKFQAFDLTKPLRLDRRFDLALSLEVAEHLPADCAAAFVDSLVRLAPVVLFSAAIPFQEGSHHLNEQWPEYWAQLFRAHDYLTIDCLRERVWKNEQVDWWYAQNILLFAHQDHVRRRPALQCAADKTRSAQLSLVHPRKWIATGHQVSLLRQARAILQDVASVIPQGAEFILIDQDMFERDLLVGHRAWPFLERNGRYWGPPVDDKTAISELERMRRAGAGFMVFISATFWWFEHYPDFASYLREKYRLAHENGRVVIFEL